MTSAASISFCKAWQMDQGRKNNCQFKMEDYEMNRILVSRFFEALGRLKAERVIRGVQTFTSLYGINRRNLWTLQRNPGSGMFHPCWLSILVTDFKVSAHWLLTGEGSFYCTGWDSSSVREYRMRRAEKG